MRGVALGLGLLMVAGCARSTVGDGQDGGSSEAGTSGTTSTGTSSTSAESGTDTSVIEPEIPADPCGTPGRELWWNEREGTQAETHAVAIDSAGAVIVTGRVSDRTWVAKYTSDGESVWSQDDDSTSSAGVDVATDGDELLVLGTIANARWLRRINGLGNEQWYEAEGDQGVVFAAGGVAVGEMQTIYVVGWEAEGMDADGSITARHPDGGPWWATSGGPMMWELFISVATSVNTDVGVGGSRDGNALLVIQGWDSDNVWTDTREGTGDGPDSVEALAYDSEGNLLVAGYLFNASTNEDVWIAKYNENGAVVWEDTIDQGALSDRARGVAVSGEDDIYVIATFGFDGSSGNDRLYKYSPDGEQIWAKSESDLERPGSELLDVATVSGECVELVIGGSADNGAAAFVAKFAG